MSLVNSSSVFSAPLLSIANGHKYNLVKDIFETHKQEIKTSLAPAKEHLSAVRKASKCIKALKNEVLNRQGTLESKIYKDNRKLVDIITARTHEHVEKLRHITEEKVRDLDSQVEQLDTIETQLSSGVDMVEETLTTGTPVKVVSIKTAIARQVKELHDHFTANRLTGACHTS